MYLIVGLGNPGPRYDGSRHNIGFEAVDKIASSYHISLTKLAHKGMFGEGSIQGEKVLLIKPQTFMNLSGECVAGFKEYYKVEDNHVIVLYDDVSLETGKLRVRPGGGAGGHNGMKSIIYMLKTDAFVRIRMGVGSPKNPNMDLADYVLGRFAKEEMDAMRSCILNAEYALELIVRFGADYAMNKLNGIGNGR